MIVIIDYGMGNLRSVQKAIEAVGSTAEITSDPTTFVASSKVILPGVGGFADAMSELRRTGLGDAFREAVQAGKPCLGVCLGLQLLFDNSTEDGEHAGLGLLPGRVVRFGAQPGLKVPHMGWNTLRIRRPVASWRGCPRSRWSDSCTRITSSPKILATSPPRPTIPIRSPRSSVATT